MTAKYWTKDGEVMCKLTVRTVFDFKNMDTGEVVTLGNMHDIIDTGFLPVVMPKVKTRGTKTQKVKKTKAPKIAKTSKRAAKSEYKGVRKSGKKFTAQCWDGKKKTVIHLGSFESELLAAAAVEEKLGNHREAKRLLNEHEEGDPLQEQPSEE